MTSYRPVGPPPSAGAAPVLEMPPRPAVSYSPAPVAAPPILGRPWTVRLAVAAVQASCLLILLAMANQLAHREELFGRLLPKVADVQPDATNLANERNTYAVLTLFVVAGAVVALMQLWMAVLAWKQRRGARYVLAVTAAVGALVAGADIYLVAAAGPYLRDLDRLLLEGSILLAIIGCVPLFSRTAQDWYDSAYAGRRT
jgi:hypothetical protein